MRWHELEKPLLGRKVLELLGLNTKEIFSATNYRFHGTVDIIEMINSKLVPKDTVAHVIFHVIYHSGKHYDDENEISKE